MQTQIAIPLRVYDDDDCVTKTNSNRFLANKWKWFLEPIGNCVRGCRFLAGFYICSAHYLTEQITIDLFQLNLLKYCLYYVLHGLWPWN